MSKTKCPDMSNKYYLGIPLGEYRVKFEGCYGDDELTKIEYEFKVLTPRYCGKLIAISFPTTFGSSKHKDEVLKDYYRLHCCLSGKRLDVCELGTSLKFIGREYQLVVRKSGVNLILVGGEEVSND